MTDIYEKIKGKRIVIWGVGRLQCDLEGLYSFSDFLYYVDDSFQEKDLICVPKERIYSPEKLVKEDKNDLVVIICKEAQDDVISSLVSMGYGKENYILGQELLFNGHLYEQIQKQKVYIWGTGGSYFNREREIREYLPEVAGFIVTDKREEMFQGREILSKEEAVDRCRHSFIIVASIYYKDIYEELVGMGFRPGWDFLHLETFVTLGNQSAYLNAGYQFDDRRQGQNELLVVLAGYKEFVWESVFPRLRAYAPEDMDICIVTSGLTSNTLKELCKRYGWSYLSTERNNVSLAVNLAVWLHPEGEYIYKMDEDIFVTEGVFETLKSTYLKVEEDSRYSVGFVAPLIPVHGYGYVRLLEIFHSVELWEERFGRLKYSDCFYHDLTIWKSPQAARFMWGEGNPKMNNLDRMQKVLQERPFQYSICPIRHGIGFILFHRENWMKMGTFPVQEYRNMGVDEEWMCGFCMMQARVIVIAENAVAGHLGYGEQNAEMERYYQKHKERFLLS